MILINLRRRAKARQSQRLVNGQTRTPGRAGPYVLIGPVDKLIEDLRARRERWGMSYYVIFEPYVDAFAPVVARLAGG